MIGAEFPPIPSKLVFKIEAGEFADMAELLPDRLGVVRSLAQDNQWENQTQMTAILNGAVPISGNMTF